MKKIANVGARWLVVAALAVALLACLSGCGSDQDAKLVGTWDAYYMIVGDESTGVDKGDIRMDLTNKGTFNLSAFDELEMGDWSYDGKTLTLDYGGGVTAKMPVSFISDTEISTQSEDGTVLTSWRKR